MPNKTWLITGAGRGLGAQLAQTVLAAGDNVVATARDSEAARATYPAHTDRLLLQSLDVTDATGPQRVVDAAVERFGAVDVLVNNAGYGHLGLFEEAAEEDVQRQLETNVAGMMRMTRAILPMLRSQRSGHIINIGSIAGLADFDFCTLYGMSKFAVEGFSVNLARDLAPFGIHVTVVEPGYFRTDFLDASSVRYSGNPIADYDDVRAQTEALYQGYNHKQPGDPAKFGPAILRLANEKTPPRHLLLGSDALAIVRKALTARLAEMDAWESLSLSTDHDDVAG
ncbi:Putative Short chain dehydrogenase\3-oxoacyl-[acyl-carrier-protein] reductase [Sodalis praecaptivus]|uniref:Putative Short chain dehydrogenase\3-oxoacyl-[acyl-carrier-protein] reductase n=1 Tax=Sodalis praecaptivus TaxID=1239307 RepID=K7SKD6_9GAMM|nr:oxidoreductase [Sodalis praecaptivus]AFW03774.1 Putative Short chain dehydrogenase\3-oxoacyl-[acyl-carrier-protein] reductase [Sodalis praecaptivus]AHF78118.1 Putative Short chain dehydrogenase\3-oxoacyl-[acyl-carrier-protein] reductase [Sodalis praecaptivus]